eukprot:6210134-Pleurochrysis_carterae.AAC.1
MQTGAVTAIIKGSNWAHAQRSTDVARRSLSRAGELRAPRTFARKRFSCAKTFVRKKCPRAKGFRAQQAFARKRASFESDRFAPEHAERREPRARGARAGARSDCCERNAIRSGLPAVAVPHDQMKIHCSASCLLRCTHQELLLIGVLYTTVSSLKHFALLQLVAHHHNSAARAAVNTLKALLPSFCYTMLEILDVC